jgi:hypothetical protein
MFGKDGKVKEIDKVVRGWRGKVSLRIPVG